jgi:hypothetical protein
MLEELDADHREADAVTTRRLTRSKNGIPTQSSSWSATWLRYICRNSASSNA